MITKEEVTAYIKRVKEHATYIKRVKEHDNHALGSSEETTKRCFIGPLFTILGYDVTDPRECASEYRTDFGKGRQKSREPVDWAFMQNGRPIIYVEAKEVGIKLPDHYEQLGDYFNKATEVRLGILTNGIQWRFFTDSGFKTNMEAEPFEKWDVLLDKDPPFQLLTLLQKSEYNPQVIQTVYARKNKKIGERYSYRKEAAFKVELNLGRAPGTLPERQMRKLAKLANPDDQRAAYKAAESEAGGGLPEQRHINKAVGDALEAGKQRAQSPGRRPDREVRGDMSGSAEPTRPDASCDSTAQERREIRNRWVRHGQYAVEVEVEVVYSVGGPTEPCLEPATIRRLDEIARRAERGDVDYLRTVGRVFQAVVQ